MKAAVFKGPGMPLEIGEVADPTPGPTDLVLAVRACGICGTDLHWTEVREPSGGWRVLSPGCVLGHEFAGEIVEVGADVRGRFRIGERVCALPFIGCGQCAACLRGRVFRCAEVQMRAAPALSGAYAQYTRVGAAETVRLPDGVDHRAGALVEPLAVGLAAVERARLDPGETVLIVGAGPVGLAVALWCRFLGARQVVVSDLVAVRAERAMEFGATAAIDAGSEEVAHRLAQLTGGAPQVVFECVGLPGTLQLAVDEVAPDGRVVVAGLCMGADRLFPAKAFVKALDLHFTFCYERRHFEIVVDHLASGRLDPSHLVTGGVGFADFPSTFERLKCAGDDLKVMFEPD
jgi:(R,R)-butanediol dehydrogenase/meso-butanediol dehydrogenase/diacetyl reductase